MINFNDIPRNIFYYILFSKNTGNVIFIFLYDLLLLLLFHIGRHQRGTRAGFYRQQERFMRFLYQLSSAHYNWGRQNRRRYESDRSEDDKK